MIRGIIYKYISPSNKVYIGQTINEKDRRKHFLNTQLSYGGNKIDNARRKYGPENFIYIILEEKWYYTKEDASKDLDLLECYYIGLNNSYENGYNSTLGGGTTTGYKFTKEQKETERARKNNNLHFTGEFSSVNKYDFNFIMNKKKAKEKYEGKSINELAYNTYKSLTDDSFPYPEAKAYFIFLTYLYGTMAEKHKLFR